MGGPCGKPRPAPEATPRFPGLSRIHRLRRLGQEQGIATAIHLCGRLARRVNAGNGETLAELVDGFDRIQVNAASYNYRRLIEFRTAIDTPVIVQDRSNFAETPPAARLEYLLDPSGGRGIESIHAWVRPWPWTQYGFAGGVGPENIRLAIDKLNELGAPNAWIDMGDRRSKREPLRPRKSPGSDRLCSGAAGILIPTGGPAAHRLHDSPGEPAELTPRTEKPARPAPTR